MKSKFIFVTLLVVIALVGCGKKETEIVEDVFEEPVQLINEKPDRTVEEKVYDWIECPTTSTKVGSTYTFTTDGKKYITTNAEIGQVLFEALKWPHMTAQIQIKPTTVTNQVEFNILDYKFYDDGELLYKKGYDNIWIYYKDKYKVPLAGDKFSGTFQLTGVREAKTVNNEPYLSLTFTDENFKTFVCRAYDNTLRALIDDNDINKWYDIEYRVDEGLTYFENKTDYYYSITSMSEY